MSVASYFDTDFVRVRLDGVTDVQSIIDEINTILTSTLPVDSRWTDQGSGRYRCPIQDPNDSYRFFSIQVVRTSQSRLQWVVRDQGGSTVIDGRVDINVAGSVVKIWAGTYHLAVQANGEVAHGQMLDMTPFSGTAWSTYTLGYTRRASDGTLRPEVTCNYAQMNDPDNAPLSRRIVVFTVGDSVLSATLAAETSGGSSLVIPVYVSYSSVFPGAEKRFAGTMYQAVIVDGTLPEGSDVQLSLDNGVLGTFEVTNMDAATSGFSSSRSTGKLAFRKT